MISIQQYRERCIGCHACAEIAPDVGVCLVKTERRCWSVVKKKRHLESHITGLGVGNQ